MTAFDHIKAMREEIAGLGDVAKTLNTITASAERKLSEAEAELLALMKLKGFVQAELQRKIEIVRRLEKERDDASK